MIREPLLAVDGLSGYLEGRSGLRRILHRVSLEVHPGRAVSLLGESGSGKTFLAHSVLGLHRGVPGVVAGQARVLGVDLFAGLEELVECREGRGTTRIVKDTETWAQRVAERLRPVVGAGVTLVPQDPTAALPPFHRVEKLLTRALLRGSTAGEGPSLAGEARRWLERVHMYGVEEVLRSYPHQLSGGMAQRVALALALAPGPELLIADEPTTGLDASLRMRVLDLLDEVAGAYGVTLFLITHDTEAARLLTREVAVLCAGRIVEQGPVSVVLDPGSPAKHPYTGYLLDSERWLAASTGGPPSALSPGESEVGCGYMGACPQRSDECGRAEPPLERVSSGDLSVPHRIACWRKDRRE